MATLNAEQMLDMIESTRDLQGKMGLEQITANLTDYPTAEIFLRDQKRVVTGLQIKHELVVKKGGAAREVGLYEEDQYNVANLLDSISIPWRHANTNYSFDLHEEAMNAGMERIVNLIGSRRFDAMLSLLELTEERLWEKPATSADERQVFGIPYWLVKNNTVGFNGGDPAGFSAGAGGLATATYAKWKNYSGQYVNFSDNDLVSKVRRAKRLTKFKTPANINEKTMRSILDRYRIHTTDETIHELESLARSNNENLGKDLGKFQDMTTILGVPITYTPQLDTDSTNPLYMINYDSFTPFYLKGFFMKEAKARISPKAHNVIVNDVDTSWNLMCMNRRQNTVFNQ